MDSANDSSERRTLTDADPKLRDAMDDARPGADLDEHAARARVKHGLFAEPIAPVVLARYVLLERIGSGGLGVVFAAYDPSLDRRVAIKLLQDRPGVAHHDRLVREAQAIARLAHPNVVAVHDVGSYALDRPLAGALGRGVFVVMEFVDGEDLDAWVRRQPRAWQTVLAVVAGAGRGLAAAHRAGLVHRDFKPSNVLVGSDGRPRVLDFGLVRAASDASGDRSETASDLVRGSALDAPITVAGRMIGTPAYMAPEQHRGELADARADQYAFCLTLYESIYGQRAFVAADVTALGLAKHDGAPIDPRRRDVPRRLFEVIVRGLRPDPDARWPDMGALLDALDEVVRRRRRARLAIAAATIVAGAAAFAATRVPTPSPCAEVGAAAATLWSPPVRDELADRFAASSRVFAGASQRGATVALDDYFTTWARVRTASCEAARSDDAPPPEASARVQLCLDRGLARAAEVVTLLRNADDDTLARGVELVDALPRPSECERATDRIEIALPELERRLARADALADTVRFAEAETELVEALALAERSGAIAARARVETEYGRALLRLGRVTRAREMLQRALVSAEQADEPRLAASAQIALAAALVDAAELPWARGLLELVDARTEHAPLPATIELARLLAHARLARGEGELAIAASAAAEAATLAERELPAGHTSIAHAHMILGAILAERGEATAARAQFERAREVYRVRLGPDHPLVADVLENVGNLELDAGRIDAAADLHREALAVREAAYGSEHPMVAFSLANLASCEQTRRHHAAALEHARRAHDVLLRSAGAQHPDVGVVLTNLANILLDTSAPDEAVRTAATARRILGDALGDDHPRTAYAIATEGIALTVTGRYEDAIVDLDRAREIFETRVGPGHPALPLVIRAEAEAELARGDLGRARELTERAAELFARRPSSPLEHAHTRLLLAALVGGSEGERLRTTAEGQWREAGGDLDHLADVRGRIETTLSEVRAHGRAGAAP